MVTVAKRLLVAFFGMLILLTGASPVTAFAASGPGVGTLGGSTGAGSQSGGTTIFGSGGGGGGGGGSSSGGHFVAPPGYWYNSGQIIWPNPGTPVEPGAIGTAIYLNNLTCSHNPALQCPIIPPASAGTCTAPGDVGIQWFFSGVNRLVYPGGGYSCIPALTFSNIPYVCATQATAIITGPYDNPNQGVATITNPTVTSAFASTTPPDTNVGLCTQTLNLGVNASMTNYGLYVLHGNGVQVSCNLSVPSSSINPVTGAGTSSTLTCGAPYQVNQITEYGVQDCNGWTIYPSMPPANVLNQSFTAGACAVQASKNSTPPVSCVPGTPTFNGQAVAGIVQADANGNPNVMNFGNLTPQGMFGFTKQQTTFNLLGGSTPTRQGASVNGATQPYTTSVPLDTTINQRVTSLNAAWMAASLLGNPAFGQVSAFNPGSVEPWGVQPTYTFNGDIVLHTVKMTNWNPFLPPSPSNPTFVNTTIDAPSSISCLGNVIRVAVLHPRNN